MSKAQSPAQRSIRSHLLGGLAVVALLAGGVGGLAATTELSGAVIAPGSLVVDSNVKKVQHPTGGVVGELRARDGDKVKAGDIVVRLDETITQANLAIVVKSLNELQSRLARLEAERDNVDAIVFPAELLARADDPELARSMTGERNLFEFRKSARAGQKAQLRERIAQLKEEIQGLTGQVAAKKRETELIGQELEGVRDLWRKNLVQIQRVTALERDAARLEGERGQLIAVDRPGQGQDLRDRAADPADRSGSAQRGRQGPARGPGQDCRARRAQGRGRGPAEAHRYPSAAERDGAPVDRPHGGRGDHARRGRSC